ncbi:MAG: glycerate kinase [Spirochaetia bacterium]
MTRGETHADLIFRNGISRVDPGELIRRNLSVSGNTLKTGHAAEAAEYDLDKYRKIMVLGAGKASTAMASETQKILGTRITRGVVAVKTGEGDIAGRIDLLRGDHPVPGENSRRAADRMLELARKADEETLVLLLFSGGGSALLANPASGEYPVTMAEMKETTSMLLASGAVINEVNCVRKHLSDIKGGNLAKALSPAAVEVFLLSDVIGDDPSAIASGPAFPDHTTYQEAFAVLSDYGLTGKVPRAVLRRLRAGVAGEIPETPGPGDPAFGKVRTRLIGSNRLALEGCREEAERLGYSTLILSSHVTGEAREAAKFSAGIARDLVRFSEPLSPPACILSGGETTVTIKGAGKGGRNQESSLAFLMEIMKNPGGFSNITYLSAGTDGNDGPTDAAGAFASPEVLNGAEQAELDPRDYLENNDSYSFFKRAGGLYRTGFTGTNVCDIQIILIEQSSKN